MFTKEEAAAMAAGQDDAGLDTLGRQWGFLQLACDWEGIQPAKDLKTTDFSRANPFVHRAWRHSSVQVVKRERQHTLEEASKGHIKLKDPGTGKFGEKIATVTEVVFKGE